MTKNIKSIAIVAAISISVTGCMGPKNLSKVHPPLGIEKVKETVQKYEDLFKKEHNDVYKNSFMIKALYQEETQDCKLTDFMSKYYDKKEIQQVFVDSFDHHSLYHKKDASTHVWDCLIKYGAKPDAAHYLYGGNAFNELSIKKQPQQLNAAKYLLKHGVKPNLKGGSYEVENRTTPIQVAIEDNNVPLIELLLENGATVNSKMLADVQKYHTIEPETIKVVKNALGGKEKLLDEMKQYELTHSYTLKKFKLGHQNNSTVETAMKYANEVCAQQKLKFVSSEVMNELLKIDTINADLVGKRYITSDKEYYETGGNWKRHGYSLKKDDLYRDSQIVCYKYDESIKKLKLLDVIKSNDYTHYDYTLKKAKAVKYSTDEKVELLLAALAVEKKETSTKVYNDLAALNIKPSDPDVNKILFEKALKDEALSNKLYKKAYISKQQYLQTYKTFLTNAIDKGDNKKVEVCLSKLGDLSNIEIGKYSLLDYALGQNISDENIIKIIENSKVYDAKWLDKYGNNLLHTKLYWQPSSKNKKSLAIIKYLVETKKVDINTQNNKKNTPLDWAYKFDRDQSVIDYLKSKGAKTNVINEAIFSKYKHIKGKQYCESTKDFMCNMFEGAYQYYYNGQYTLAMSAIQVIASTYKDDLHPKAEHYEIFKKQNDQITELLRSNRELKEVYRDSLRQAQNQALRNGWNFSMSRKDVVTMDFLDRF